MLMVGIVGAGIRGRLFAQAAVMNGNTVLKAFCDINKDAADFLAK